jgi:hypothetical protein
MLTDSNNLLSQQWLSLHNDHEQYERYALLIKLFAIVITLTSFVFSMPPLITTVLLVITWLLEGVWKTFQARTASAIITIEKKLIENEVIEEGKKPVTYYSMYSQWQANRRDLNTLFREYITSSLKPTVLFPYLLLLMLAIVL